MHSRKVELLISKDNECVNQRASNKSLPIHEAAWAGNKGVVKMLLENGAKVTDSDNCGYTALHWASENQTADVSKLIIEFDDSCINQQEHQGITALAHAIEYNHFALVQYLSEHPKCDNVIAVNSNETPLEYAKRLNRKRVATYLQAKCSKTDDSRNGNGLTEKASTQVLPVTNKLKSIEKDSEQRDELKNSFEQNKRKTTELNDDSIEETTAVSNIENGPEQQNVLTKSLKRNKRKRTEVNVDSIEERSAKENADASCVHNQTCVACASKFRELEHRLTKVEQLLSEKWSTLEPTRKYTGTLYFLRIKTIIVYKAIKFSS